MSDITLKNTMLQRLQSLACTEHWPRKLYCFDLEWALGEYLLLPPTPLTLTHGKLISQVTEH